MSVIQSVEENIFLNILFNDEEKEKYWNNKLHVQARLLRRSGEATENDWGKLSTNIEGIKKKR